MIIYNITVNINDDVHDEWLKWMKEIHIPDVMKTGCFKGNRICKVLVKEEKGTTYSIQYTCNSMEEYNKYQKEHASRLQIEHSKKYVDKFVAFRTLLEVV